MSLDILSGVRAISSYLYGDASASNQRRTRHLIDKGVIPTRRVLGRIESRQCWIDPVYAKPDQPKNGGAEK